jgi:hypothetical protein
MRGNTRRGGTFKAFKDQKSIPKFYRGPMLIDLDRTTEHRTRKGKRQKPQTSIIDFIGGGRQKPQRSGGLVKNSKKQKKNKSGTSCFNCRKEGYWARDCSKLKQKSKRESATPEKYSYNIELNMTDLSEIAEEQSDSRSTTANLKE